MPERLAPVYEERTSYFVPAALALAALVAIGIGTYVYFQDTAVFSKVISGGRYKSVLERLDISTLPPQFEKTSGAARLLDQLLREPCDREAIVPLAKLMVDAGYPREGAKSSMKFGEVCGYDGELLEGAYAALTRIGDLTGAVTVASEMIKLDQARGRYRFLRGTRLRGTKKL